MILEFRFFFGFRLCIQSFVNTILLRVSVYIVDKWNWWSWIMMICLVRFYQSVVRSERSWICQGRWKLRMIVKTKKFCPPKITAEKEQQGNEQLTDVFSSARHRCVFVPFVVFLFALFTEPRGLSSMRFSPGRFLQLSRLCLTKFSLRHSSCVEVWCAREVRTVKTFRTASKDNNSTLRHNSQLNYFWRRWWNLIQALRAYCLVMCRIFIFAQWAAFLSNWIIIESISERQTRISCWKKTIHSTKLSLEEETTTFFWW